MFDWLFSKSVIDRAKEELTDVARDWYETEKHLLSAQTRLTYLEARKRQLEAILNKGE